jgi:hypothetical protein
MPSANRQQLTRGKLAASMIATKNLYHRAPGRLEEAMWHPETSTGRSRRGGAAVQET